MKRILALSDIHGEIDKFGRVLEEAGYDATNDQLILLGEYINRATFQSYEGNLALMKEHIEWQDEE